VPPKCYDTATNQEISCTTQPPPATMVQVLSEYAKARNFAKKFMSYFVVNNNAVKLGYVAFTKDVVITRDDGKQVCANELAAAGKNTSTQHFAYISCKYVSHTFSFFLNYKCNRNEIYFWSRCGSRV
jgi:hypothetical protein